MRCNQKLSDGRSLQQLYRHGQRGQQVQLERIVYPLTVSWFWLKRSESQRELRFVLSTHSYSSVYLVQLGCKRWVVEGFFKTIKHRFGWHCFGQLTKLGVYRWLILSPIAYLLAHWVSRLSPSWCSLDWGQVSTKALGILPQVVWLKLLRQIQKSRSIIDELGFEIIVKSLPLAY